MSNTVPCTGNCGVSNHVAGSASHKTCQARTSAMAAHPAGKGRADTRTAQADFSNSPEEEGRRQAAEYIRSVEKSVQVPDYCLSQDEIREEIIKVDAEIDSLMTEHKYDKYASAHSSAQRGGRIMSLTGRKSDLINALAHQSILIDKLGEDGFSEVRDMERNRNMLYTVARAAEKLSITATDRARLDALADQENTLADQLDDYRSENGNPWQEMMREWRDESRGLVGAEYLIAEQSRLREALTRIGADDLLDE